jgi:hypothetical protein
MTRKLESPTCVTCAREAHLMSTRASYTAEQGVCANCGEKTWVTPLTDWYRVKPKASEKTEKKKAHA